MLELLLGQIPEAIYFALFMIFTKELKSKRILYVVLMVAEYLLLKHLIVYNIWFQIAYTIAQFIILKILYKEKAQITDIFAFAIASAVLILISFISYFVMWITLNNYYIAVILCRILLFTFLIVFHKKLCKIQKLYKLLWNRTDKKPIKMKSTTFRAVNLVIFNIMFYIINLGMIFTLFIGRGA